MFTAGFLLGILVATLVIGFGYAGARMERPRARDDPRLIGAARDARPVRLPLSDAQKN